MARDRSDAAAPAETDTPDPLAASANGDVDHQPERAEGPTPPEIGRDGSAQNGPGTHELLAPETPKRSSDKSESGAPQLISGDPLLRAPRSSAPSDEAKPKPPGSATASRPSAGPARPTAPTATTPAAGAGSSGLVPGVPGPSSGHPATRRASRGAHVAAPREVGPPAVPPERPVATLRPRTVAPVPRLAGRRPRVRRVTRVVRHVDPWSVFKVSAAFSIVAYAIALIAGVLLWNVAYATGTIDNIERGMESTGWEVFELDGAEIFRNAWIGGLFAAVGLTGLAVLVATLFNLITDLVGGVRLTVLEEEVVEKTASPMRRFATAPASRPGTQENSTAPGGAQDRIRRARGG